jgi:hypothetical protein
MRVVDAYVILCNIKKDGVDSLRVLKLVLLVYIFTRL